MTLVEISSRSPPSEAASAEASALEVSFGGSRFRRDRDPARKRRPAGDLKVGIRVSAAAPQRPLPRRERTLRVTRHMTVDRVRGSFRHRPRPQSARSRRRLPTPSRLLRASCPARTAVRLLVARAHQDLRGAPLHLPARQVGGSWRDVLRTAAPAHRQAPPWCIRRPAQPDSGHSNGFEGGATSRRPDYAHPRRADVQDPRQNATIPAEPGESAACAGSRTTQ